MEVRGLVDNVVDGNSIRAFATRQSIARRVRSPILFSGSTGASFSFVGQRPPLLATTAERDASTFIGPTISSAVRRERRALSLGPLDFCC